MAAHWLAVVAMVIVIGCDNSPAAENKVFRAGAALLDITPTNFPVLVNAMFEERTATKAADRLHVRERLRRALHRRLLKGTHGCDGQPRWIAGVRFIVGTNEPEQCPVTLRGQQVVARKSREHVLLQTRANIPFPCQEGPNGNHHEEYDRFHHHQVGS